MIKFTRGNLFEDQSQALVNTVNCVGVMGKGVAYQFKRMFPEMYEDYRSKCMRGEIRLGEVDLFTERGRVVINFPTKNHWRGKSRLEDVENGLRSLRNALREAQIGSVAMPPLGCGNGGLTWGDVKSAIECELGALEGVEITVYEPAGDFRSRVQKEPRLSLSHFVLAAIRNGLDKPTKLNIQKAAYFFNVFSGSDYFSFTGYRYGPYCVAMDQMFNAIRDYLDYTRMSHADLVADGLERKLSGEQAEQLRTWFPAIRETLQFCNSHRDDLELLATAHAVVARSDEVDRIGLRDECLAWSEEKASRFDAADVEKAAERLVTERLLERTLLGYGIPVGDSASRE